MPLYVDIEKSYGDFKLKVCFETDKELFAILGASGCGKSLTLKCIAGIEKPDRGVIKLNKKILYDSVKGINLPARKRKIGYLFQNYALFPHMTVMQNIMCGAKDKAKAEEFVCRFFLEGKEKLYPHQLSGGQMQRVALARMLSGNPEYMLFDEPFSALDNYLKAQLEREVLYVMEGFENGGIFVSHDRNEVFRMTNRIAVMENGSLMDIQEKHELFSSPKTLAATLLTGCKNVTRLEKRGNGYYAIDWDMPLRVIQKEDMQESNTQENDVQNNNQPLKYVGIRAHFLEEVFDGDGENVIECEIQRVIEDTFSMIILFKNKRSGQTKRNHFGYDMLTYELPKEHWQEIKGRQLYLRIPPDKLILMES